MRLLKNIALIGALTGALAGCDGGAPSDEDGGLRPDAGEGDCDPEGVAISGEIGADTTWACPVYLLEGPVFVTAGATLTVLPGVEVLGDTGGAAAASLIVTRGARIVAEGTAEAPIVFGSGNPEGARATGDWAGLALLGAARTNDGECVDGAGESCAGGHLQDRLEGVDPADPRGVYGGTDDASDCGSLRYVRIEFAGRELSPDNELNGLTLAGCGSATRVSHVQIHRGKDDGLELFGGTASFDHVVITGASDDSLDFDEGWRGNGQFVVLHQLAGLGDRGIEADNLGADERAAPVTRPNLFNLTLIGTADTQVALFREGMQGIFGNLLVTGFGSPPDVHATSADPAAAWPADFAFGPALFHEVGAFPAEDLTLAELWAEADAIADGALADTVPADVGALLSALEDAEASLSPAQTEEIDALLRTGLDDDLGFDEEARFLERGLTRDGDPSLGASGTAPDYVPSGTLPAGVTPVFNAHAPSGFGDAGATYLGALDPDGDDWTAGWTAYPER